MTKKLRLRITLIAWKGEGTRLIELRSLDEEQLPPFDAGSHIDLHLPNGLVRSYSLLNSQSERHRYLLGVARDPASRGGSKFIHDNLVIGQTVEVTPPRNLFRLDEDAAQTILIAGGIGVTPLLSMAARLTERAADWTLYYAARSRADAAFAAELREYGDRVKLHCDDEQGGVLDLRPIIEGAAPEAHFYCCGPKPMMTAFGTLTRDLDPSRIHVEYFQPNEEASVAGGFLVEARRSGRTVAVPEGSTILEALSNAGIFVMSSCRLGLCGTCEIRVLAGEPDHRDAILTPEERAANDAMMVCCSGSKTERLVLDI